MEHIVTTKRYCGRQLLSKQDFLVSLLVIVCMKKKTKLDELFHGIPLKVLLSNAATPPNAATPTAPPPMSSTFAHLVPATSTNCSA